MLLCGRRVVLRVSPGQRHLDDGHHLGRVDQPQPSAGRSPCLRRFGMLLALVGLGALGGMCAAGRGRGARRSPRGRKPHVQRRVEAGEVEPNEEAAPRNAPSAKNALDRDAECENNEQRVAEVTWLGTDFVSLDIPASVASLRDIIRSLRKCGGKAACNGRRRRAGGAGGRHEAGRARHRRRPDEPHAGQALAQRLRQGGINSVNDLTRQQGDSEWMHFDDTVYGGDFLQHQPPVKEMADWGPRIIDLMDRLGVTFNRTPEGFRDQRRFGGTLFKRTAFAGATTGQQLLYALDEQVRRWEVDGKVTKYECWDFLGPILDDDGRLPRLRRARTW